MTWNHDLDINLWPQNMILWPQCHDLMSKLASGSSHLVVHRDKLSCQHEYHDMGPYICLYRDLGTCSADDSCLSFSILFKDKNWEINSARIFRNPRYRVLVSKDTSGIDLTFVVSITMFLVSNKNRLPNKSQNVVYSSAQARGLILVDQQDEMIPMPILTIFAIFQIWPFLDPNIYTWLYTYVCYIASKSVFTTLQIIK